MLLMLYLSSNRHFTLGIYRWFEMHGRLLSAKDLAQMQYSQKRLVMDFYLQFFSSNLDFTSDPSQVFRFLVYLTKITFCDSKLGFPIPTAGVSSKIGMVGHSLKNKCQVTHNHVTFMLHTCLFILNTTTKQTKARVKPQSNLLVNLRL